MFGATRASRKGGYSNGVISPYQRMGARASVIVGLICLGVASTPGIATACMPPPRLPDESSDAFYARLRAQDEARALRFQQELWSRADRVFTARVELAAEPDVQSGGYRLRRGMLPKPPKVIAPVPPMYGQRETNLLVTPVAELKGLLPARAFKVTQQASWSSCGPVYTFNDGPLQFQQAALPSGEAVIVFLTGPYPTQAGVLGTLRADQIVDPNIKAAMAAAGTGR